MDEVEADSITKVKKHVSDEEKDKTWNRKNGKRGHLSLKIQITDRRDRRKERVARLNKSKMT